MNETQFPPIPENITSFSQIDSTSIYVIYEGGTVVFRDVSEPEKDKRPRYWDLDLNVEGYEFQGDTNQVEYTYNQVGNHVVLLCIDNDKHCTRRAISVREKPIGGSPPPPPPPPPSPKGEVAKAPPPRKPKIELKHPNVPNINWPGSTFNLKVGIGNVSDKESVSLTLNGRDNKFNFKRGILTSTIPLQLGQNDVKVIVNKGGATVDTALVIMRKPDAVPAPIIGFTEPPTSSVTTQSDKYDIVVSTVNVTKKDQLKLTVGGQSIKDFNFSPNTGEVRAKVPLKKGMNPIQVIAQTGSGKTNAEVKVTLESGGIEYAAVLPKNVLNSCNDYSVKNGSVTLTPKKNLRLMETIAYSSECGSINMTLSGGGQKASETFELTKGGSPLVFSSLDGIELEAGTSYTLTFSTGKSTDCPNGSPQLLNTASCGKNASGDQNLDISYGGKVSLFKFKYNTNL